MNVFASRTNIDIGCGPGSGWGHELLRRDSEGLSSVGNLGKYQIEGSADCSQVGFRSFIWTTAAMTAWLGPLAPGFFRALGENSRRYFRFFSA